MSSPVRHFARPWILLAITALCSVILYFVDGLVSSGHHHMMVTGIASKLLLVVLGVVAWDQIIDRGLFPNIDIRDVMFGEGDWNKAGNEHVRAAIIRGYFLVGSAIILVVGWGGM